MASQTEENYLKALFSLANNHSEVSISDLATHQQVSMPTVNSMVKTLQKNGWVIYQKYKPVKLTPKGRKKAALIIRKHRLTEMFLVKKMGFGWEEVHEIAEQIEHIDDLKFFERMDKMLGHPSFDPHGSPIPDAHGRIQEVNYIPLSTCKVGQVVKLAGLTNSSTEFLEFLNGRELSLGSELEIISIENFDSSMQVSYQGHPHETLTDKVCEKLLVQIVKD